MKKIIQFYKYMIAVIYFSFLIAGVNLKGMFNSRSLHPEALRFRNIAQQKILEKRNMFLEKERLKKEEIERLVKAKFKEIEEKLKENKCFIYENGTVRGITVSKDVLMLSKTLQNMMHPEDALEQNIRMIPFKYPYDIIKPAFAILKGWHTQNLETKTNKEKITAVAMITKNQSSQELVKIFEFMSETLDCNDSIKEAYSSALKDHIWNSKEKMVQFFSGIKSFSLWKTFLVNPAIIGYLKGLMMKYNMAHIEPEYLLPGQPSSSFQIRSITPLSNTTILVGMSSYSTPRAAQLHVFFTLLNKLCNNIVHSNPTHFFINTSKIFGQIHKDSINTLPSLDRNNIFFAHNNIQKTVFNPKDNTKILIGLDGKHHSSNLLLYSKNPTTGKFDHIRSFIDHDYAIKDIAFNFDGSKIISVDQYYLKLWNTNNDTPIKSWTLPDINSIAFSADGTKIIATYSSSNDCNEYCNTTLCIIDLNKPDQPQYIPLIANNPYNRALSFTLTKDDQILAWDSLGNIFLITFDHHEITNEIQIQEATTLSLVKKGMMACLTICSDDKKMVTARTMTYAMISLYGNHITIANPIEFIAQNFLELYTSLTDFDSEVLKLFKNIQDSDLERDLGKYSLIYQFWLNSRKGIKNYKMDATEQKIYNSFPEQIKRLFQ